MATSPLPRILCVDDEPAVLESLARTLHRRFDARTAEGGAPGLAAIERDGPFAVVMSDMRMPGMNGAEFLSRVHKQAPQTVRILLTGQSDLDAAIAAVNEGQIFRFLAKPCAADRLEQALDAGVEQYRLLTAERELLEKTLMGSLQTLNDVLALSNPEAFGRATRIKQYVTELATEFDVPDRWQVETAAMLSQIGYVTLDPTIVGKVNRGQRLSVEEQRMVDRIPGVSEQLLAHIPRLEGVRAILSRLGTNRRLEASHATGAAPDPVEGCARLVRIALDFDRLDSHGLPLDQALSALDEPPGRHDSEVIEVFRRLRSAEGGHLGVQELPLSLVRVGMEFAEDVRMQSGVLLAARGYVVTRAFVERARNFQAGSVIEPVRCLSQKSVPPPDTNAGGAPTRVSTTEAPL